MQKTELPLTKPLRDPPGWCNLHDAFVSFGAFGIGSRLLPLSQDEMEAVISKTRHSGVAQLDDQGRPIGSNIELAKVYYFPMALTITSAVRSGRLKSAYGRKGGGDLIEMPPSWWRTDDPMLRYKTWCVDPDEPFSTRTDLPCWVFVSWDGLNQLIAEMKAWRRSLPDFYDIADDIDDRLDRMDYLGRHIDCQARGLVVSLVPWPKPGIWFTCPRFPVYDPKAVQAPIPVSVAGGNVIPITATKPDPVTVGQANLENGASSRTKAGRPRLKDKALAIFRDRLERGVIKRKRSEECALIISSWKMSNPPEKESVSKWIRHYHGACDWEDESLTNAAYVLGLLDQHQNKSDNRTE